MTIKQLLRLWLHQTLLEPHGKVMLSILACDPQKPSKLSPALDLYAGHIEKTKIVLKQNVTAPNFLKIHINK